MIGLLLACGLALGAEGYIGWNPLAVATAIPAKTAKIATPIFSGLEYGLALSGGLSMGHQDLQLRGSFGSPHGLDLSMMGQVKFGYRYFLRDTHSGLHLGADARVWDLYYRTSEEHFSNVMPGLGAGWWWDVGPLYLDLGLELPIAVCSWSSLEGTTAACGGALTPAPDLLPVLPLFSLDIGRAFAVTPKKAPASP